MGTFGSSVREILASRAFIARGAAFAGMTIGTGVLLVGCVTSSREASRPDRVVAASALAPAASARLYETRCGQCPDGPASCKLTPELQAVIVSGVEQNKVDRVGCKDLFGIGDLCDGYTITYSVHFKTVTAISDDRQATAPRVFTVQHDDPEGRPWIHRYMPEGENASYLIFYDARSGASKVQKFAAQHCRIGG